MCDSPLFSEFGLGIHNLPGPIFPYFDLYKEDPIDSLAVDPGLTASPYSSSPNSSFPSPEQLSGSSPLSCHEYFADPRDSIGSLDAATIAPQETVTHNNAVAKHSSHNHSNNAKSSNNRPSKAIPSSALASTSSSTTTITTTPAAAPQPPANTSPTSPIVTRTRKASSQNTDASGPTTQPRAKKQKTTITVKLEPQEPQQQRPPQQRQRQSSPPKRKPARRGSTAKGEDVAQRTKNLERNRIAASKCRQKKKEWVVDLEVTKNKLEAEHAKLRDEYYLLLSEVTAIKNELMAHAKCQDPNINFWIDKEALKYVERCMDPQERRPSMVGNAASGSSTLPSPAESHRSQQEQSLLRPEGGINLDYMPDELLTGDLV